MDSKSRTAREILIYEALRFANWAAGEGICPVEGENAKAPEDFLMEFSNATNDEDWDTFAERISALPSQPVSELVGRLRDRAESYRMGGPSSEHTAAILDEAATTLEAQEAELSSLRMMADSQVVSHRDFNTVRAEKSEAAVASERAAHAQTMRERDVLKAELRETDCPRPCNHRPDDFTVGQCVDADECGCRHGAPLMSPAQIARRVREGGKKDG